MIWPTDNFLFVSPADPALTAESRSAAPVPWLGHAHFSSAQINLGICRAEKDPSGESFTITQEKEAFLDRI